MFYPFSFLAVKAAMWPRRLIAAASFVVYATAAALVSVQAPAMWAAEYSGDVPVAISNVAYGRHLGMAEVSVLAALSKAQLAKTATPATLEDAVAMAGRGDLQRRPPRLWVDGLGLGQALFTATAMRLFGIHLVSMAFLFILLMGAASASFIMRYDDRRLIFIPLLFASLTLMLLTPMVTTVGIRANVPIGGNRYFSILGIVPLLHLFFEFLESQKPEHVLTRVNWCLVATQTFLLSLVIIVRDSNAYMLLPLTCAGIYTAFRLRKAPVARTNLYRKIANVMIFGMASISLMMMCTPIYMKSGRVYSNVWHRTFVSLELHPDFPFGNMSEIFHCTPDITGGIPGGLSRNGNPDLAGGCIWAAYGHKHGLTLQQLYDGTFGPQYELALREAYFYVVTHYPRQLFELYFYYKPIRIIDTLKESLHWRVIGVFYEIISLGILEGFLLIIFTIFDAMDCSFYILSVWGTLGLFFIAACAPQLAAWASLWTSADLILYFYAALLVVPIFFVQALFMRPNQHSQLQREVEEGC